MADPNITVQQTAALGSTGMHRNQSDVTPSRQVAQSKLDDTPAGESRVLKASPVEELQISNELAEKSVQVAENTFSVERIQDAVRSLEEALPKAANKLSFHVDEVLNRPVITVIDKMSGEVLRTLPSDEVIRVMHNIESMRGILFEDDA